MKTVMLVDDSRFACEEMKRQMDGTEFLVVACCRDAEDAMAEYENKLPDVVVMDIVLPGIDGIEATRQLLEKYPSAAVVVASSLAYDETVDAARKIGAQSFLFKPVQKEQLLEVLQAVTIELHD